MSDKTNVVFNSGSPEEVAYKLFDKISNDMAYRDQVFLDKDQALGLYAECLNAVRYPSRRD